ncbi:MAG: lipopolysaccharide heptosyltransferase family protein [Ignavibacteriaceae bacterium]|nr:lipopolysaccharide heptosyltransferase family protein [Ignavibacteriaceae bacterium]
MDKKYLSCRRFNGYKPCFPDHDCFTNGCREHDPAGTRILIINLDAMGDVLMTTSQLPALKKKYPVSEIHWLTEKISAPLLLNNQYIDKVHVFSYESLLILENIEFDVAVNLDKSQKAASALNKIKAEKKMGFGLSSTGKIIPVNEGAVYNYRLGMDDHLKFRVNTRTKTDYVAETMEIDYDRSDYVFNFTENELEYIRNFRSLVGIRESDFVVGFNTGCSTLFPNKKMTVDQHIKLIQKFIDETNFRIMLLGGPEDKERNEHINSAFSGKIINTPVSDGVRKGACYESLADVIITGDSFGLHLGIALKKYTIVWFGLSCHTEIDLFDQGVKFYPRDLFCSPCWKKSCPYNLECVDMIDLDGMFRAAVDYYNNTRDKS